MAKTISKTPVTINLPKKKTRGLKKAAKKLDRKLFGAAMMYPFMNAHHMQPSMGYNPMMSSMLNPAINSYMNPFFSGIFNPNGLGNMNAYYMTHVNHNFMNAMHPSMNMYGSPLTGNAIGPGGYGNMMGPSGHMGMMGMMGGMGGMGGMGPMQAQGGMGGMGQMQPQSEMGGMDQMQSQGGMGRQLKEAKKPILEEAEVEPPIKNHERILRDIKSRVGNKLFQEEMAKVNNDFANMKPL